MKRIVFTLLFFFSSVSLIHCQTGLKGDYYRGRNFEKLVMSRTDQQINFNWDNRTPAPGMPATDYSIRWTGRLQVPETGEYQFSAVVDDGIRLWVGGIKVIDAWGPHDDDSFNGKVKMKAGQQYDIRVEYFNGILEGQIQLMWELPEQNMSMLDKFMSKPELINRKYFSPPPAPEAEPVPEAKPVVIQKIDPIDTRTDPKTEPKPEPKPEPKAESKPNPIVTRQTASPNPPPAALPKPTSGQSRMRDTIQKYTPKNVLFGQGEPFVLEESFPELDRLVKLLQRFEALKVQIDGHTDITGDPAVNLQLSKDRANEVAYYLKEKGIAADRIKTQGFGASRPLFGKDSTKLYPQNRRVEFTIK
jgi:outer membrane protein OmpA-like peptidoglycan-associated protein